MYGGGDGGMPAVAWGQPEPGFALAETVGQGSLLNDVGFGSSGGRSRDDERGESPFLSENGGVKLELGLGPVDDLSLSPYTGLSHGLDDSADSSVGNVSGGRLRLGRRLYGGNCRNLRRSQRFHEGLGVVNDPGGFPDLCDSGRVNNSLELGLSDTLSLHKLESLGSSCGIRLRQSMDVGQGLELGCGEGVLKDLGPVDDLGRNPYSGRGHDVDRGKDLSLRGSFDL